MRRQSVDITPKPGKPTEALLGGPFNGMVIRKLKSNFVAITGDNFWYAIYWRNKDDKLTYTTHLSPTLLLAVDTNKPIKGM